MGKLQTENHYFVRKSVSIGGTVVRRRTRRISILLLLTFLLSEFSFLFSIELPKAEATTIGFTNMWQDPADSNKMYYVGLGYYDMWLASDGVTWTGDGHQPNNGERVSVHSYTFDFQHPTQNILDVQVSPFNKDNFGSNGDGSIGEQMFQKSRGNAYSYYQLYITSQLDYSASRTSISGLGTKSVSGTASITNGWLTANNGMGEDRRAYEESQGQTFAPLVQGWRVYFPVLYTITLEPIQGTAMIRHFTTDGQSLNGVFHDRDQAIVAGQNYTFPHPTHPEYEYKGWKKSTVSVPSGGSPSTYPADPDSLLPYDGSFPVYYVYFYYEKKNVEMEYELDVVPATWTMKVGDMKEFVARNRYRETGTSSWSSWNDLPDNQVTWTIGNSAIATMDANGFARGVSPGTTLVRAAWNGLADSASLTVEAAPLGAIDGDFRINPNPITMRDSFNLIPEPFTIPDGCTYTSHSYRFSKDGYAYSEPIVSRTATTNYPYSKYPSVIDVGSVYIAIKINADCGGETITTGYIKEKPLVVQSDGRQNEGPIFSGGWFNAYEPNPTGARSLNQIVLGQRYDLGIVKEPHEDPNRALPRDPEGDYPITYTWNFRGSSSTFIQGIHDQFFGYTDWEKYGPITVPNDESLRNTYHSVRVTARDRFGTPVTERTVGVTIVGPEPFAVCHGEVSVKSGRPFVNTFDTSYSYSPLGRSVTVDHWEGIENPFLNLTDETITKTVKVWVRDSAGLVSKAPGECVVKVLPDPPPIAKLAVPSAALREPVDILSQSYSPDGDLLVSIQYQYKYDAANNGFADDPWYNIAGGDLNRLTFQPNKVGNYLFSAVVCEDYGRCSTAIEPADPALRTLEVRNLAPEVSFRVVGENNQPQLPEATYYNVNDILNQWSLVKLGSGAAIPAKERFKRFWTAGDWLHTGSSSGTFGFTPLETEPDMGLGHSRLSPYRAPGQATTNTFSLGTVQGYDYTTRYTFYVTDTHIIMVQYPGSTIRAMKKSDVPTATGFVADWTFPMTGMPILVDDELWVFASYGNVIVLDPLTGQEIRRFKIDSRVSASFSPSNTFVIPGKKEVIIHKHSQYPAHDEKLYKINKDGQLIQEGATVPAHLQLPEASCRPGELYPITGSPWFRGEGNDLYRYEFRFQPAYSDAPCASPGNVNTVEMTSSIVKLDMETMTYQWRTMTAYPKPRPTVAYYNNPKTVDNDFAMLVDVINGKLFVKSAEGTVMNGIAVQELAMNTGAVLNTQYFANANSQGPNNLYKNPFQFAVNWNGTLNTQMFPLIQGLPHTVTADGRTVPRLTYTWINDHSGANGLYQFSFTGSGRIMALDPVGDGILLGSTEHPTTGERGYFLSYAPPSNDPLFRETFYHGHFVSPATLGDTELGATVNMRRPDIDSKPAGLSFRMQNVNNRYAVELNGASAEFVKYVNGTRTVLRSASYPMGNNQEVAIRVIAQGNMMSVYLNGVPYFEGVSDGSFASGHFGIFTDKPGTSFRNIYTKGSPPLLTSYLPNYAIWEEGTATANVQYQELEFTDPEGDPQLTDPATMEGLFNWTYAHTPKFLNNQGLSGHHLKTYAKGTLTFDKVGEYTITLEAYDDPHPDYRHPSAVFSEYRRKSNPYQQTVIVHRRPVAVASVIQNPSTGRLEWSRTEQSYDPDRWVNATTYSAPDTPGMNYGVDKGIAWDRYFYRTPDGALVEGKLTHPTQLGTYEVYYQVMDEYGAWSYPWSGTITVTRLPVNRPPVAEMTAPNGTEANPTRFTTYKPTLYWKQTDPDPGTVFKKYQLQVTNATNTSMVLDSGELNQNTVYQTNSWIPTVNLPAAQKLRVRVRVNDGTDWSDWSPQTWFMINNPPAASLTFPTGTKANPTIVSSRKPTITWSQTDPDPGAVFACYEVEIINEQNTWTLQKGSDCLNTTSTSGSWSTLLNLPEGENLQVRVRVSDGVDWSPWSAARWMRVELNQAPVADFDWSPKPAYEGDDINLVNKSTDPDGDPLSYLWTITAPNGTVTTSTTTNVTMTKVMKGAYNVKLRATDPSGASDETTKTIVVQDLTIQGQVSHTPEWEAYRQSWNARFSDQLRAITDFWAGEALVLTADVSDTGASATKPQSVRAELVETGDKAALSSTNQIRYTGTMIETNHARTLSDGPYRMRFTVTWTNGHVETDEVPFQVKGNIYDVIVLQQRL